MPYQPDPDNDEPIVPVETQDAAIDLGQELLDSNLFHIQQLGKRIDSLDGLIKDQLFVAKGLRDAQDCQRLSSSVKSLIEAYTKGLEERTVLYMASIRPLLNALPQLQQHLDDIDKLSNKTSPDDDGVELSWADRLDDIMDDGDDEEE